MFGKLKEKLAGGSKKLSGKTDLLEGICGIPVIMQASMADGMSVRERAGVVKLRAITPEYSDYVRVRELSDYLNDC